MVVCAHALIPVKGLLRALILILGAYFWSMK
jgi:hypothetical protein